MIALDLGELNRLAYRLGRVGLVRLGVVLISGLCAGCVPRSLQYYVPSAEGAKIVSYSCSGNPPYQARFLSGGNPPKYALRIGLEQQSLTNIGEPILTLMIDPFYRTLVTFDPTQIRVEADGQLVVPKSTTYYLGKSGGAPAIESHGPIHVETDYLIIDLSLGIRGALDVNTQISPIALGEEVIQLPDVSFKLERHTLLYSLVINC
jgi:hypothetical protein